MRCPKAPRPGTAPAPQSSRGMGIQGRDSPPGQAGGAGDGKDAKSHSSGHGCPQPQKGAEQSRARGTVPRFNDGLVWDSPNSHPVTPAMPQTTRSGVKRKGILVLPLVERKLMGFRAQRRGRWAGSRSTGERAALPGPPHGEGGETQAGSQGGRAFPQRNEGSNL